jgi:hypothetical protein
VRVSGLMRHGAPYVAAGDRLALEVRVCPGLDRKEPAGYWRHGRALIAAAISGRAD